MKTHKHITNNNQNSQQNEYDELGSPKIVDRKTFQADLDTLRVREKAHTREGDAIAAARRRLPMVEVDSSTPLIGKLGKVKLLDAFEGRRMLIAYYFMWYEGKSAKEQCEGCTLYTSQVLELSFLHSRDVTYAVFCQVRTKKAPVIATSWPGKCLGTQPRIRSTLSWLVAGWECFTSFAIYAKDPRFLKLTGRTGAASRQWTIAMHCSI